MRDQWRDAIEVGRQPEADPEARTDLDMTPPVVWAHVEQAPVTWREVLGIGGAR